MKHPFKIQSTVFRLCSGRLPIIWIMVLVSFSFRRECVGGASLDSVYRLLASEMLYDMSMIISGSIVYFHLATASIETVTHPSKIQSSVNIIRFIRSDLHLRDINPSIFRRITLFILCPVLPILSNISFRSWFWLHLFFRREWARSTLYDILERIGDALWSYSTHAV